MHHPSEIDFEVIWRSLNGLTDEEEEKQLQVWINDHPAHVTFFRKAQDYYLKGSNYRNKPELIQRAWLRFSKKNFKSKVSIRPIFLSITGIAAAILIIVSLFFFSDYNDPGVPISESDIAFMPGTNKAILIIEDGSSIELASSGIQQINIDQTSIVNTGTELVYQTEQPLLDTVVFHTIIVPRGGEYMLIFSDGSKVYLNAESRLRYPIYFSGHERRVELTGEAFFEVAGNQEQPFIVSSGNQIIRVIGTHFNVSAYPDDDQILTTLVEGSIDVYPEDESDNRVFLLPNEQSQYNRYDGSLSVIQVHADSFAAWRRGRFVFRDMNLDEIMKKLSRWYDCNIEFINSSQKEVRFTGNLQRYSQLEDFLKVLEKTHEVQFYVRDNTVFVK